MLGPFRDSFIHRFLSSLRARLMLLHPSPNCSLRAENLVHVHFKEEIGIAELIPLVTTYIILFAYIYFSTRRSQDELPNTLFLLSEMAWSRERICRALELRLRSL